MIADIVLPALIVVGVLIVLVVVGLILGARKHDGEGPVVRRRPRFVQTIARMTIRRKRQKNGDEEGERPQE
jgi:hypothetical protein